jgi:uncharacterized membrane protein YphA (DoxX/SURF4 family)
MKIVAVIAQILLGLTFLFFGLNGFLQFLHGPLPSGDAGNFIGVLMRSHYVYFVSGVQLIAGILLLINRFVPLAAVLLAAVIANILVYHLTMNLAGIPLAIVVAVLWLILAYHLRAYLAPIFAPKTSCGGSRKRAV